MLTERIIRDSGPALKTRILWDNQVKGLGVRITPTGLKAYVLDYRMSGRRHRAVLARTSELSLREARKRAGAELVRIRTGESDPLTRRREARIALTVNEGLDRFFAEYVPTRIEAGRMAKSTVDIYRRQAARYLRPALGKRQIADVTRREVERMMAPIATTAPVHRNRVLAFTSRLFRLFEDWELRPQHTNPTRGIDRAREEARDRVLTPTEMTALGEALASAEKEQPAAVAAIRVAALTGLRIGEVLSMRWDHIEEAHNTVMLPHTKTGRRKHVLPSAVLKLLAGLPRINDYMFTIGNQAAITYHTVRKAFMAIAHDAGLPDLHLHDLRRTFMTGAARSGLGTHVLRDLLGHKTTAMADRYIRHAGAAVHEAQEHIGTVIEAQLRGGGIRAGDSVQNTGVGRLDEQKGRNASEGNSPVKTPRNPPHKMETGVSPPHGHETLTAVIQSLYDPDTSLDEHYRKISEYRSELKRLRTRLEQEGQCPSFQEALNLVRRYPVPNPKDAERIANFGLVSSCVVRVDGQERLVVEPIQALLEVWQDEEAEHWERFRAQEALEIIVDLGQKDHLLIIDILQRLNSERLNRPRGRYDPRTNDVRDMSIIDIIGDLQRLGIPAARNEASQDDAGRGNSACDVVAKALEMEHTAVETVWKRRELRG